ncbi:MAG: 16S rRNA (uracil(1498)-N(3))-methyltransferase, partial [Bifidobacteriaceae bacterium]|nr:16S rRNA (uracil(1498)-N(3))-methyltransferase [Bifidobacteriaceae bacterium]
PWQAERSIPRWLGAGGAKAAAGRARWVEIVRREGKVARRGRLPVVEDVVDSPGLTARLDRAVNQDGARGIVLLETAAQALASELAEASGASAVWLVVGPEGSITPAELTAFAGAGARTARLGPEVLRTALAGVAALVLAAHQLGRWS